MRRIFFFVILALALSFAPGLYRASIAQAAVDPSAVSVRIEPGGLLSRPQLDFSAANRGPFELAPRYATFWLRKIGARDELSVAALPADQSRTCRLTVGAPYCWLYYRIALPTGARGAYELILRPDDRLVTSGEPIAQPSLGDWVLNYYFPDVNAPPLSVGARFIAADGGEGGVGIGTYWTLIHMADAEAGSTTYTFAQVDHKLLSRPHTVDVTDATGEATGEFGELVDDPITRRLSQKYANKPLWTFGRFVFRCWDPQGNVGGSRQRSVRLWRSRRSTGSRTALRECHLELPNPNWWQGGIHQAYEVYTDEPLFVLIRPNQSTIHVIPPTVLTTITTRYHYGPCIVGAAYFVDDWAFERVFTTEDPHTAYPEWTAQQRADILKYQFDNGMDHTMVAFAAGYPSVFGTRAELKTCWRGSGIRGQVVKKAISMRMARSSGAGGAGVRNMHEHLRHYIKRLGRLPVLRRPKAK